MDNPPEVTTIINRRPTGVEAKEMLNEQVGEERRLQRDTAATSPEQ